MGSRFVKVAASSTPTMKLLIYVSACSVTLMLGSYRHDSLKPLTNSIAIDTPTAKTNTASMPKKPVTAGYSDQQIPPIQPLPISI